MKTSKVISSLSFLGSCGRNKRAFSLVEVVLALGIFSVSILSIVGLMATGLNSANGSSTNLAVTNIMRELRANIQSMPFSNLSRTGSITYHFGTDGYTNTASSAYYYTAILTPAAPAYPSGTSSTNADTISVVISYPYPANSQSITNSIFVAQ